MLRAVVGNFLDSLTEREFDAPLLALLASQGFYDIHFIHGGYEFGKDVIAKREDDAKSEVHQYSIQSKAGDIAMQEWRKIRPQIDECEYNTRAHPLFDAELPRVAVLVTTGRLKGAAAVDAQEYKERLAARGIATFEMWDRETILDWLTLDPSLGLTPADVQDELLSLISTTKNGTVSEPALERFSRRWLLGDPQRTRFARASIEASIICNSLRQVQRSDLAALTALHLYRATWTTLTGGDQSRSLESSAALGLFEAYTSDVLGQVEPLLSDPLALARPLLSVAAMVTYPAACVRLIELLGLLVLTTESGELAERAGVAVGQLCANHPGSSRPIADQFAVSIIPPVLVIAKSNKASAVSYLRAVANWLLDRHDPSSSGLGLASLDEDERTAAARLLGGSLESTKLERRRVSYLATVVLDLLLVLDETELYDAVRENFRLLQIIPTMTAADEQEADWRRGGERVWPHPAVEYPAPGNAFPEHHSYELPVSAADVLLLTAVCRSRHYPQAVTSLLQMTTG